MTAPKKFHRHTGKQYDDLAKETAAWFKGNEKKHIRGKNITELLALTGKKSRQSIYDYLDRAIELGVEGLKKDEKSGHYIRVEFTITEKFEQFSTTHPITQDPLVDDWIKHGLANAGFSGNGAVASNQHVFGVSKLCNYLKVTPLQLIQEKDVTGKYLQLYLDGLRDGTIQRRANRKNSSPEQAFKQILMGTRHFIQFHGIALRKGEGGIWNAKVMGHGNFADVKLSDEQFVLMEDYLLKHGGIDSDLYRIVWVGIESCARKSALLTIPLDWTKSDDDGDITFFMTAIETKTKHIKNGKQIKHITRKRTQDSLEWLKDRKTTTLIWEEKMSISGVYLKFLKELKKMYAALGCTNHYFFEEPFHSLRHIGAHYWLKATDYDYYYVADLGGWDTPTELRKSYGEIPPEVVAKKMKKFRSKIQTVGITS